MDIDILVVWPRNADYPLWRQMVRDNRSLFNKVIVVFMETYQGEDFRNFIKESMIKDSITFIEPVSFDGREDWRNILVNEGLKSSLSSEWIWFTEQDFFPESQFFSTVFTLMNDRNTGSIGVLDGDRLHPCSLFVRRSVLAKTNKDFSAKPPIYDHFGRIQKDLEYMRVEHKIVILKNHLYTHMAGLSHNMRLVSEGGQANHKVEEFRRYLKDCLGVSIPLHPTFRLLAESQVASL